MDRRSCLTLTALRAAGLAMTLPARAAAGLPVYLTGSTSLYRLYSVIPGEIPLYYKR